MVVAVLSNEDGSKTWWDLAPIDVKDEVTKLEAAGRSEELDGARFSRQVSPYETLPQLLKVIDFAWKEGFDDLIRDKALIQQARVLAHLRNTLLPHEFYLGRRD